MAASNHTCGECLTGTSTTGAGGASQVGRVAGGYVQPVMAGAHTTMAGRQREHRIEHRRVAGAQTERAAQDKRRYKRRAPRENRRAANSMGEGGEGSGKRKHRRRLRVKKRATVGHWNRRSTAKATPAQQGERGGGGRAASYSRPDQSQQFRRMGYSTVGGHEGRCSKAEKPS